MGLSWEVTGALPLHGVGSRVGTRRLCVMSGVRRECHEKGRMGTFTGEGRATHYRASRQIHPTGISSSMGMWSLHPQSLSAENTNPQGGSRLGGWLRPAKARLSWGSRQAVCWGRQGHTQGWLEPGRRLPVWLTPGWQGRSGCATQGHPCVGSTAGLPGTGQHNLHPSHFTPVAPRDGRASPGRGN